MTDRYSPERRALLKVLLSAPAVATLPALSACSQRTGQSRLDIASGEEGGMYFEFAQLLSAALVKNGIAETSAALKTEASAQNLDLLVQGRAHLALALADTVAEFRAKHTKQAGISALGRVYQNYFHCIVKANSGIESLRDFPGRTIGTGAAGSGTWVTGQRILQVAGLKEHRQAPAERMLGYASGMEALGHGDIDVLFLFGGMPVRPLTDLARAQDLRLLDVTEVLGKLRDAYPGLYDRVVIPGNTYPGIAGVDAIGVSNLLMARSDLPVKTAKGIVKLLTTQAHQLVPGSSSGIQHLTPETLVSTAGQPLHPGARDAYLELHG
ncbi:TAXI family TRAP transporter solute-binding subunit [Glutamicibacter sp. JL.03c]|uniref:TAXI family TRAP transporter solute-binding subunit n=1 Tax=Glutamicibacter sp. JL.03c TaxID=2984842 RepID=UPI0021F7708F|nr:TAXI family TRAP transporter solute-binding subunit [Glutamicibacter sp. JL.03c]UYQ79005.1 TAXI family TRAP transporter solute-binding subunit [Glutamicibacter sp. JL.03c]